MVDFIADVDVSELHDDDDATTAEEPEISSLTSFDLRHSLPIMASIENAVARRDSVGLTGSSGCVSGLKDDVTTAIAHMLSEYGRAT